MITLYKSIENIDITHYELKTIPNTFSKEYNHAYQKENGEIILTNYKLENDSFYLDVMGLGFRSKTLSENDKDFKDWDCHRALTEIFEEN